MKSIFLCIIFTFGYSQINWDIEVVDSLFYAGACGSRNALCLDSNDTPHVVYSYFNVIPPDSGFKLMYAVKNGNVWHYEVIDTGTVLAFTGPSLQVDDNGIIHVSYYTRHVANPGSTWLCYSVKDDNMWRKCSLDTMAFLYYTQFYTSLALDSLNLPGIAYLGMDSGFFQTKYAYHNGADWDFTVVNPGSFYEERGPSLEYDDDNNPHIVYYQNSPACSLKYSYFNGSQWSLIWGEEIDAPNADASLDLALNSLDYAHIVYGEALGLRYSFFDGTSWHTESNIGGAYFKVRMDLDVFELPHIISTHQGGGPFYIYRDSTEWHSCGLIDSTAVYDQGIQLMFDSYYHPNVIYAYYYATYFGLKYAKNFDIGVGEYTGIRTKNKLYLKTIIAGPIMPPAEKDFQLFDILGREVHTLNPVPGVYFLQINGKIKQKLIKIR